MGGVRGRGDSANYTIFSVIRRERATLMRVLLLLIDTGRGSPEASCGQQSPGAPK